MKKYGKVAVLAVQKIHQDKNIYTIDAWTQAAIEIFTAQTTRHKKACPKSTFLGLCEAGLIKGISSENIKNNLRKDTNKQYALIAISILKSDPSFAERPLELWKEIWNEHIKENPISHNFQMDVVTALWNNDLINTATTSLVDDLVGVN
ncbi:hypothetical protein H8B09_19755 [Paenibacillus sp. PR3]|uniref:Uncharacterized protein n=1 Tax=Paenibacillus terricola TaxID=2763503 RepID=A0ABR8MYK6_9BACL|nr:hypothetical protein [Paenibacillus terricola]MBD3921011.1 hypothetical protein [Paenibacillus terricola]